MNQSKERKTTRQLLSEYDQRMASGQWTPVDILSTKRLSPFSQEAIRGAQYFLKRGCLHKILASDVEGGIV